MPVNRIPDCVLCLDVGSQSIRAQLVGRNAPLAQTWRTALENGNPARIDLAHLLAELFALIDQLAADCPEAMARCQAVAITAQRATQVFLDASHHPLADAISWQDQDSVQPPPMPLHWHSVLSVSGHRATIETMREQAPAWKLQQREPEAWQRCRFTSLLTGWLNLKLTGRFADCAQAQIGYLPFLHKHGRWAIPGHWMWGALPLSRRMLPKLVPAGEPLGRLIPALGRRWGLPADTPVIACAGDKAMEALGSGCLHSATAVASLGTQITVHQPLYRYRPANPPWPIFPGARPGSFLDEVDTGLGARHARALAARLSDDATPERHAEKQLDNNMPISLELQAYRDYLERIACQLVEACQTLARQNNAPIEILRLTGGLSQSRYLQRATRRAGEECGLRIETQSPDTGLLGTAITAWHGVSKTRWLGLLADLYQPPDYAE